MSSLPVRRLSPAEYLRIERAAEQKSEFYRGEIFLMPGATREHNLVVSNTVVAAGACLEDSPCEVYVNDMRVKVGDTGLYTYPDIVIVCEKPQFEDEVLDTLLNPRVIFEALSKSTEAYDRGTKFRLYRSLDTLKEYVMVSQERPHVERYVRQDSGDWVLTEFSGLESTLTLTSIDCRIPLATIYRRIEFETDA